MHKSSQVSDQLAPQLQSITTTQLTRLELARTLGELQKLGLINPLQKLEKGRSVTRYALTQVQP